MSSSACRMAKLAVSRHIPEGAAHQVVFVRHGQSTWNKANRFIGWTDTELTHEGEREARHAGRVLKAHGVQFDEVHTSMLKRSIKTAWLMLEEMGLEYIPVFTSWRLNERSYGALVGMNKKDCVARFGKDQVKLWRRGYDHRPPAMDKTHEFYPGRDTHRYSHLHPSEIPLAESLQDTKLRAVKYWNEVITPAIRSGKRVLVVGHENNLRSLLMNLDNISQDDVIDLEVPRAVPVVYELDSNFQPITHTHHAHLLSGHYLGMHEGQLKAIQERDMRQVYDLDIKVNLEEMRLKDAVHVMQHTPSPSHTHTHTSVFFPHTTTHRDTHTGVTHAHTHTTHTHVCATLLHTDDGAHTHAQQQAASM